MLPYLGLNLDTDLFTPAQGYDGIGIGVGNGVYSIGTYGGWPWQDGTKADMWANTDPWVNWFDAQAFSTPTDYFLYLIDESDDYPQIEQWAQWMDNNPGPGQRLMSLATISLPDAMDNTPSLDIPTSGAGFGITSEWENALAALRADPSKHFYPFNLQTRHGEHMGQFTGRYIDVYIIFQPVYTQFHFYPKTASKTSYHFYRKAGYRLFRI